MDSVYREVFPENHGSLYWILVDVGASPQQSKRPVVCSTSITYAISSSSPSTTPYQTFFLISSLCRLALAITNMQEPAAIMTPSHSLDSRFLEKRNGNLPTAKYLYMQVFSSLRSDKSASYRGS